MGISVRLVRYIFGRKRIVTLDLLTAFTFQNPGATIFKISFSYGEVQLWNALENGNGTASTLATCRRYL